MDPGGVKVLMSTVWQDVWFVANAVTSERLGSRRKSSCGSGHLVLQAMDGSHADLEGFGCSIDADTLGKGRLDLLDRSRIERLAPENLSLFAQTGQRRFYTLRDHGALEQIGRAHV